MASTSEYTYIESNPSEFKVSKLLEGGFKENNFEGKTLYKVSDILSNIGSYDFYEGKIVEEGKITAEKGSKPEPFKDGVQIGDENVKGIICEKPNFPLNYSSSTRDSTNTVGYYFPLGTAGRGESAAIGFKIENFLKGKEAEISEEEGADYWEGNLVEAPLKPALYENCLIDFEKDSGYDNDVFYNFEGAHIISDKENRNLLKFPQVGSPIQQTVTVQAGEILEYSLQVPEDYRGVYKVEIQANGGEYSDYTIDESLIVHGKHQVEEETSFEIKVYYHRGFTNTDGTNFNWYNLGKQIDQGVATLNEGDNFLKAEDLVIVNSDWCANTRCARIFRANITIPSGGTYYTSLYAKSEDGCYLHGMWFIPEETYVGDITSEMNYIKNLPAGEGSPIYLGSETSENEVTFTYYTASTEYALKSCNFRLYPYWNRAVTRTTLSAGNYKLYFWVTKNEKDNLSGCPPEFRICGLKVEKDYLTPYDYRSVSYTEVEKTQNTHVLSFNFEKLLKENATNSDYSGADLFFYNDWTISYLRRSDGDEYTNSESKEDGFLYKDSIGDISIGIKNYTMCVDASETLDRTITESHCSPYNNWEKVIITHLANSYKLIIEVYLLGERALDLERLSIATKVQIKSAVAGFLPTLPHSITGEATNSYNLILGGAISGTEEGKINTYNGVYRDLWFFPRALQDEEKDTLFYDTRQAWIIRIDTRKYRNESSPAEEIVLQSPFIKEIGK